MYRADVAFTFAAAVLLSGCGTTAVNEVSPSTYSVAAQYGALNGSWARAQRDAVAHAKEYCASKGKAYTFIKEDQSGVYGFSPQRSVITFSCGQDAATLVQAVVDECKDQMQTPELDLIRAKVELQRDSPESPVPFGIATIDAFPAQEERAAIAKWATIREDCFKRHLAAFVMPPSATPLQITQTQEDRSFGQAAFARVGDLIVALYQQKLTYGEFAKKRYEFSHDAAEAERQYRQSLQLADQQQRAQAQQFAQQQFANNLAVWSTYMQAVNARQPQTVYIDGTIRVQR